MRCIVCSNKLEIGFKLENMPSEAQGFAKHKRLGKTKQIDMTKVFGIDRNVITPDNNNIEAAFFTAKSLSGSSSKFVQSSLNFKEQ